MRGQDDIAVLNMESILPLDHWKAINLEFVGAAGDPGNFSPIGSI